MIKTQKIKILKGMQLFILFTFFLFTSFLVRAQLIVQTGLLNVGRAGHESIKLNNDKIIVCGGDNGDPFNQVIYSSVELYNPTTGTWSYTGSMNRTRTDFAAVLLDNGNVLVVGGLIQTGSILTNSCEIYNTITGTWSYTDTVAYGMSNHKVVKLNNGKILVVYSSVSQLYDQTTQKWSSDTILNNGWSSYSLTKLADGRVLISGGAATGIIAEIYDPATNSWTLVADQMNYGHKNASSILLNNGKVMITDGNVNVNYSELFDPVTNSFSLSSNEMARDRVDAPMILLTNGNVLIYGNGDLFGNETKSLEVYDTTTNKWYSAGQNNVVGSGFDYTIHRLNTGKILIIGGWTFSGGTKSCYLVDENYVSFSSGLAQEENTINYISIYPNPAKNFVNIKNEKSVDFYELSIYQISNPAIVYNELLPFPKPLYNVDLSEFSNGVYIVKLQSDDHVFTKRIIKIQ